VRIRYPTVLEAGDEVELGEDLLEVVVQQNARVPETVSGVASPITQETERQRQTLEQVEKSMARLGPDDGPGPLRAPTRGRGSGVRRRGRRGDHRAHPVARTGADRAVDRGNPSVLNPHLRRITAGTARPIPR